MTSSEYWAKREAEALKHRITDEKEYDKRIKQIYSDMLDNCQSEINAFYGKYAAKEGITLAEAKKRVSELDIAAYERKAKRYVKEKNFSAKANEEMRLYNAAMKINRLEMLKANIGLELISGYDELDKFMSDILKGRTEDELKRQAGILGETVKNNAAKAHAIVNASFHNATFSDRVWMYQDLMRADLDKLLTDGLIRGKNPRALVRDFKKSFYGGDPKKDGGYLFCAERLMRTELARVQTEAQKQSFERNGFDEYEFIVNGGCCSICQGLSGKHFKVSKMMPGENAPPMHCFCRCSTAAYSDRAEYEEWLDFLEKGGTTEEYNKLKAQKEKLKALDTVEKLNAEKEKWLKENNYDIYGDSIEEMEKGFWEEAADGSMPAGVSWLKALNQKINSLVTKQGNKGDKIEMGKLLESSKLGATHGKAIQDIISNAPKNAKRVWNKYAKRLDVEEAHEPKGKAFCNYTKGITCDIDKVAKGDKGIYGFDAQGMPIWKVGKKPYYTALHEFGHNISALMNYDETGYKYGSIATTFKSKKFFRTITNANGAQVKTGYTLAEMMKKEGTAYFDTVFNRLKAEAKAKGLSAKTVRKQQAWNVIKDEILANPVVECSDISDMWDGISNGSCLAHYGHTNKDKQYWSKISVGEEAFAEMFSATVMNPESVKHIKHYFPQSYELFEEILKELG